MNQVKITKLCNIEIGKTPSRSESTYWGTGENWVSIRDMKERYIFNTKEEITSKAIIDTGIKLVPKNTVIMSFKLSVGKVAIVGKDMYTNEAIAAFHILDDSKLYNKYLYYVLQTLRLSENTDRAVMGLTLNKQKLKQLTIPLPQFETQKKIVEVLDKAQGLIDVRKEQISLIDELIQSVFFEMFGDPVMNSKGWNKLQLKKSCNVITGNTPSRKELDSYGDYIEWIKSDNINTPNMYLTKADEYLSEKGFKKGRYTEPNSILMTCIAGSLSCIGNVAIADRKVAFNQQINAIVPLKYEVMFLYVMFLLTKSYVQNASSNSMKGMISKSKLQELEFIVPDRSLQEVYSKKVLHLEEHKGLLNQSLRELEKNYLSLTQKAFKGDLF